MKRHSAFTLVEMLVTVAIIAVLVAILLPVIAGAMRHGKEVSCQMNLIKIHQALEHYRADNPTYPGADNPIGFLAKEKLLERIPTCPMDPVDNNDSYGELYNYYGYKPGLDPIPCTKDDVEGVYGPTGPLAAAAPFGKYAAYQDAYIWRGEGADTYFPGLLNRKPQSGIPIFESGRITGVMDPIVTICPYHVEHNGLYIVLRTDGTVDYVRPANDKDAFTGNEGLYNYYWTLNLSIQRK